VFQRSNARRRLAQVAVATVLAIPTVGATTTMAFASPAVTRRADVQGPVAAANQALSALRGPDGRVMTNASFLDQARQFDQAIGRPDVDPWQAVSGTPYVAQLAQLSVYVGARSGVDSRQLLAVWVRTDSRRMVAVLSALAQLGTPYRTRGDQPGGFDCSGLFGYSWDQAGSAVPRNSGEIIRSARPVSAAQLQPGDVVWRSGHVQMYLGLGDATVHSPQHGRTVEVTNWGHVSRFGSVI